MPVLDWIAEQRIKEAIESGELDNVPGIGKPIPLDEQLIIAYNASIQIYKKKYIVLLQEINEQISDLRFECLKDEIREGRILSHTLEMGFINILKRLEQFDSEFQPFMLIAKP